jgi:hypothetical protein
MKFIRYENEIYNVNQLERVILCGLQLILEFKARPNQKENMFCLCHRDENNDFPRTFSKIVDFLKNDEIMMTIYDSDEE